MATMYLQCQPALPAFFLHNYIAITPESYTGSTTNKNSLVFFQIIQQLTAAFADNSKKDEIFDCTFG